MVGQARVSIAYQHERTFDMGSLRRLAVWGASATVALLLAVVASYSDANSRRLMAADAQKAGAPPAQLASRLARDRRADATAGGCRAAASPPTANGWSAASARSSAISRTSRARSSAKARDSERRGVSGPARAGDGASAAPRQPTDDQGATKDAAKEATMPPAPDRWISLAARQPAADPRRNRHRRNGSPICLRLRSDETAAPNRRQARVRRRCRRRGEFRRPAGALGLDQRQQRGAVRGPAPGGRGAREQPDEKRGAAARRRAAGQCRGRRPPVRDPLGIAPLLPAGRLRGSAAGGSRGGPERSAAPKAAPAPSRRLRRRRRDPRGCSSNSSQSSVVGIRRTKLHLITDH